MVAELLQTVQYAFIAKAEDGWSMCGNQTNQFLTLIGYVHICFQPFFLNLALDALWRRNSLVGRLHNDLIQRLCLAGAAFLFGRYISAIVDPSMLAPVSEACPSTTSLSNGYDPLLQETPPSLPGFSCTYLSNTTTDNSSGHLAWALPFASPSYFVPNLAVHAFLMFAPALVHPDPIARAGGLLLCVTGPIMAKYITPSLNEVSFDEAVYCSTALTFCANPALESCAHNLTCSPSSIFIFLFIKILIGRRRVVLLLDVPDRHPPCRVVLSGGKGSQVRCNALARRRRLLQREADSLHTHVDSQTEDRVVLLVVDASQSLAQCSDTSIRKKLRVYCATTVPAVPKWSAWDLAKRVAKAAFGARENCAHVPGRV